jgi:gliding motility-associated-like protein
MAVNCSPLMCKMRTLFYFLIAVVATKSYAQVPVIQNIEPLTAFPNDTIVISGTGFSNVPANLQVWFDAVKGEIIESSDFSIVVVVPPEARFAPIEVINLSTKFSGKSRQKFTPAFPVSPFSSANFTSGYSLTSSDELWDFCTCDLNNDGKPEIATTKIKRSSPFGTPSDIMVLQNTGSPGSMSFTKWDKTNLPVLQGNFPTDNIVCGDLQGDGKPEMIVTRSGDNRNSIHIFRNTTTTAISFATPVNLFMETGHFATRMAIRDLNNDGKPEIIATNSFNDIFYIFINQSSGGTLSFSSAQVIKMSIETAGVDGLTTYETDVQDFNGDNLPDIIINQFQTSNFYILKNTSSGSISFGTPQKFELTGALNRLVSADFNKDGKLDIVFTSTLNDQRALVLLNQSTLETFSFGSAIQLTTSFEPWGVDVGDIDGDEDPDIVVVNRNKPNPVASEKNINIFLNDGNATPSFTRSDIPTSTPTRNVKLTDMDGDSKSDIVFTGFDEATVISSINVLRNTNCFQPTLLNEGPLTICNGQTIRLQTIPASNVTYTWSDGTSTVGGNLPYLNITAPGTYSVTATQETSCSKTSQVITVTTDAATTPADPVITGGDKPICTEQQLSLGTTATADEYIWTGPDNFTSSAQNPPAISVTSAKAGFYNLQIRVGQCKSDIVSKRIDVADLGDFSISSTNTTSNVLCEGASVNLFVNDLVDFDFQWLRDGADIAGQTTASLTATTEGAYTVRVTPPSTVQCPITTTDAFDLTFLTTPVANFDVNATGCLGQPTTFTNTSQKDSEGTPVYTWTFDDGQTATIENPTNTYAAAGSYDVSLNVKYQNVTGCTHTVIKPVTIVTPVQPEITSTAESSCPDEEVTLSISAAFPTITWNTSESTNTISVPPGTYSVVTIDANGCSGSDEIAIAEKEVPALSAIADPDVIPAGASSNLSATGADSYVWTPGSTLSDSLIANPVAAPVQTTTYTVTGTSADGCTAEIQLVLKVEGVIGFPVAFSPNGDGQNELWDIQANFNPECALTIFDGRGRRVFEGKGENWDGTYQGKAVPEGTYYYVYGCPDETPKTGSVLLFR